VNAALRSKSARAIVIWGLILGAVTTFFVANRDDIDQVQVALTFLLIVLGASTSGGRIAGYGVAAFAYLLLDYFFQKPYRQFGPGTPLDAVALLAFLCVATVTTYLLNRAQRDAEAARARTEEVASLSRVASETLSAGRAVDSLAAIAALIKGTLRVASCEIIPAGSVASADIPALAAERRISLRAHGREVGTLILQDVAPLALEPERERFLDAISYYAALAVERVRMIAEEEHSHALQEASRVKDLLLAGVSHDLQTPLTAISALAEESAQNGDPNAPIVFEQAERLRHMVENLLDLSRLRGGGFQLSPEVNSVEDVVGSATRAIAGIPGASRVVHDIELDKPALYARFDFVHTMRILTNLLENALRYSPADSRVDLIARARDESVVLIVADRGAGVAPAEQERIFEPFYRAPSAVPDGRRAGLGLAIARQLAEQQGATLGVRTRGGGGSEFVLTLPAAAPESGEGDPS
jgi:two-component system, OmpR family, sensor histidine kinase KdpD